MSANTSIFNFYCPPSLRAASTNVSAPAATSGVSAGALSVLLLAALVATLVLLADRFISPWADEHLFLGWVLLWAVIFGGLALFAGAARTLAAQAVGALDGWSRARAQSRAEARLWAIARSDPRVMADLIAMRAHAETDNEVSLAPVPVPVGIEQQTPAPQVPGWAALVERIGQRRVRNMHSHYI
jgi:hypothetical protein